MRSCFVSHNPQPQKATTDHPKQTVLRQALLGTRETVINRAFCHITLGIQTRRLLQLTHFDAVPNNKRKDMSSTGIKRTDQICVFTSATG